VVAFIRIFNWFKRETFLVWFDPYTLTYGEGVNRELITCIKAGGFSLQTSLVLQGEASVRGIFSGASPYATKINNQNISI
jgi:hypothetical protein